MKSFLISLLTFFIFDITLAQENTAPSKNESSEASVEPDFKKIQSVLKNDNLEKPLEEKLAEQAALKKRQQMYEYRKYSFPDEGDFWDFMSEYWLVKNAPALKWDFEKPDYGLESYFKDFLENLGYYEVSYKILLVDTPNVTHFALPTGRSRFLALVSVPFIRTLNLSKLEISLILFEDFIRSQEAYFVSYVTPKTLKDLFGKNFKKNGLDKKVIDEVMKKYDEIIFDKGFNFQQQYQTTKKVSLVLKNQIKLWSTYYKLIVKINELVTSNILYKNYTKIYPSPELQLGWLGSKK